MTIVGRALRPLDRGRQKLVDAGLRPVRIYRRSVTWSERELHLGALTETDVEITPRPKVTGADDRRLRVSNITPSYTGGGFSPADLQPSAVNGTETVYIVEQPDGELEAYRLVAVNQLSPFRYTLDLEKIDRVNPEY